MDAAVTDTTGRPVCVLGMGRTGTSLTTRVIGLLGVDLGPEETMLSAVPTDNPEGYWEQAEIMRINDELLAILGGSWWAPPRLEPGWEMDPALDPLLDRAGQLVAESFPADRRWGWKDPRASITLPFWRRVAGEMTYVICFRNPVDVAASLVRRDPVAHPADGTYATWLRFSADALRQTEGQRRLIVLFEDWFEDTEGVLTRLADFVEPDPHRRPPDWREQATAFLETGLRHHSTSADELAGDASVPPAVRIFYLALRAGRGSEPLERALPALLGLTEQHERALAEAEARAAAAEADRDQQRQWLDDVQSSTSWALTAPLRRARRMLRAG